uniref:Uncharacterized protein n=1 Tax=Rhinopithecus bieti TaxID=61621 RepID=A0A2K6KJU3_RHIBE
MLAEHDLRREECGHLTIASSCSLTSTCPHHKGAEPSPGWMLSTKPIALGSDDCLWIEREALGEKKGAESTLPGFYTPTRLSIRAQGAPRGLFPDQAELTAGQVLYIEWNLLDAASRINFLLFSKCIKIIIHSIKETFLRSTNHPHLPQQLCIPFPFV